MALYKEILESNGVITTYHRINNVEFNHDKFLTCTLESYVNKEYSKNHLNCINSKFYIFENIDTSEEENMGIRQLAYTKIKTLSEWKDSIDS